MAVRKLDVATRKEMLSRISQEKRGSNTAAAKKRNSESKPDQEDSRWKPLAMSLASGGAYLCHCGDVKRGYANVCPAHMLTFRLAEAVH